MNEQQQLALKCIREIRDNNLTFCAGNEKLERIMAAVDFCAKQVPGGRYMEAGVAMGGSALVIAAMKPKGASLDLYDVFEILPPPTEQDGEKSRIIYDKFINGGVTDLTSTNYIGASENLLAFVKTIFEKMGIDPGDYNINFVKGLFEETLKVRDTISFCHVDCDWYHSVTHVIQEIANNMALNGLIVFDDYNSFEGCKKAVDDWLMADRRYKMVDKAWSVVVQRVK